VGLGVLKTIKIRLLTPPIACKCERGPAPKQEQVFDSNEVRVSLLVNFDDQECKSDEVRVSLLIDDGLCSARLWAITPQTRVQALPACYNESTVVRAHEAFDLTFIDKDLAPRAIPERIYARKPCVRAYEYAPARSSMFGSSFQLPPSRARAVDQIEAIEGSASRFGPNPSFPKAKEELIVTVACQESTRAQGVTLEANRTEAKSARCRGAPHHARFSISRAFVRK
jgi:hypothetical protein